MSHTQLVSYDLLVDVLVVAVFLTGCRLAPRRAGVVPLFASVHILTLWKLGRVSPLRQVRTAQAA